MNKTFTQGLTPRAANVIVMSNPIKFEEALAYVERINAESISKTPQYKSSFCLGSMAQLVSELSVYAPDEVVNGILRVAFGAPGPTIDHWEPLMDDIKMSLATEQLK